VKEEECERKIKAKNVRGLGANKLLSCCFKRNCHCLVLAQQNCLSSYLEERGGVAPVSA